MLPPCRSLEPLCSAEELNGTVVGNRGAENGGAWVDMLLLATTGNKGCDTVAGADTGNTGGATVSDGWSPGDAVDGMGGLKFCTGNNGCWTSPGAPGCGTDTAGRGINHGWGRG